MLNTKYAQITSARASPSVFTDCDSMQMWYRRVGSVSKASMYSSCLLVARTKSSTSAQPCKRQRQKMVYK